MSDKYRSDQTYRVEQAVLGTILRNHESTDIEITSISPQNFSDMVHREIVMAMHTAGLDGVKPEIFNLELILDGKIPNPLGALTTLYQAGMSIANFPHLLSLLQTNFRRSDLIQVLTDALENAKSYTQSPDESSAVLLERLVNMDWLGRSENYDISMSEAASKALDEIQEAFDAGHAGKTIGVTTGFKKLDKCFGGFRDGTLTIIGARPGMGKTAWMLSSAYGAAVKGAKVGIISTEMDGASLAMRNLSMISNVPSAKLHQDAHRLDDQDFNALSSSVIRIKDLPIRIYDKPCMSVQDILAIAKFWKVRYGLDILMVDYLSRLEPAAGKKTDNRVLEVGKMAEGLKNVARRMHIPLVVLAQLNRAVESRPDKRPHLGDLRDSGMIEQEADHVIFLYREHEYTKTADPRSAEMIVAKNRHGALGIAKCRFIGECLTWTDDADDDLDYGY